MTRGREHPGRDDTKANLVGGGIASLASAAYLIRDGGIAGKHIVILEATDVIGGSLDGEGSPQHSYVIRGGRMSSSTVRRGPPPISPLVAARIPATAASSPVSVSREFVNKKLVRVADINRPA